MRASLAIAGLIGFLASTAPALADDDLMSSFQTLCLANHGENTAVIAAATQAGWMPLPASLLANLSKSPMFAEPSGLMRTSNTAIQILILSHTVTSPFANVQAKICAVAVVGQKLDITAQVAALAGVPVIKDNGLDLYFWQDDNGVHKPIDEALVQTNSAEMKALLETGKVNVLATQTDDSMSMVFLMVPYKEPEPSPLPNPQ